MIAHFNFEIATIVLFPAVDLDDLVGFGLPVVPNQRHTVSLIYVPNGQMDTMPMPRLPTKGVPACDLK